MKAVLGVSGSISAYRAADLARDMMRAGYAVRVCLTDAAQKFVTPVLFETLTGQPCLRDTFEEPISGRMAHIDWARQADLIVVAPATANTINKLAAGIGDDMLTTIALAATCPMVIAPAMNPQMYANEITRQSLQVLAGRAAAIVQPQDGDVACGEHGQGKLATNAQILKAIEEVSVRGKVLEGKHVLITSGPTQEAIDSVRFLTNRSSGKMGAALARAALLMGARVTVVSGPVRVAYPLQANIVMVTSALQMLDASMQAGQDADVIIGAAAVADYRPASPASGKIRRSVENISLELVPNPDVLAALSKAFPKVKTVGFAAEPTTDIAIAKEKLERKGLIGIAANDVSNTEIGFDSDENELVFLSREGHEISSGRRSKLGCAIWLLERIAELS